MKIRSFSIDAGCWSRACLAAAQHSPHVRLMKNLRIFGLGSTTGSPNGHWAEAEKLFGLEFSEAERRQILGGDVETEEDGFFAEQIESLRRRRELDIPNSLAPATSFDPRLPGVDYPMQDDLLRLAPEEIGPVPEDTESIAFASVKAQARWMTTGQISSRELTDIYLDRIERYGSLLECFVTVTPRCGTRAGGPGPIASGPPGRFAAPFTASPTE